jgi:hypothetical protein
MFCKRSTDPIRSGYEPTIHKILGLVASNITFCCEPPNGPEIGILTPPIARLRLEITQPTVTCRRDGDV